MVNVNSIMYLCYRVKRKEGAGLLYVHLGLYIHIGKIRYVRLLFSYSSAAHIVHVTTQNPIRDGLAPEADMARENQYLLMYIRMHILV